MRIAVDVMSGDNAPLEIIKGAVEAAEAFEAEIVVVGDENIVSDIAVKNEIDISKLQIVNATSVITMEDKPMCVVREKKNSSMLKFAVTFFSAPSKLWNVTLLRSILSITAGTAPLTRESSATKVSATISP